MSMPTMSATAAARSALAATTATAIETARADVLVTMFGSTLLGCVLR
jgi:hypothetical protein